MTAILQELLDLNPGDLFDANPQGSIPVLHHFLCNAYRNPVVPDGCDFVQANGKIYKDGIPIVQVDTRHIMPKR